MDNRKKYLTMRDEKVLELRKDGKTFRQIQDALGLSSTCLVADSLKRSKYKGVNAKSMAVRIEELEAVIRRLEKHLRRQRTETKLCDRCCEEVPEHGIVFTIK